MFFSLAPHLTTLWGPFRLLGSYLVLIGTGATAAAILTWALLPRLWPRLPTDRGRAFAQKAAASKGKPTGAGLIVVLLLLPVLFLVLPFSAKLWGVTAALVFAMITGYLDDASSNPWGEYFKGTLDLGVCLLASLSVCQGRSVAIWLPLLKGEYVLSPWIYVPAATVLLWIAINATNCSDGVDGLAGTLTLLSLFYLGGFLYIVIGHSEMAEYLLVPHNKDGAKWAILLFTASGGLAGYLWHNAEPSSVLMGDAGSRFLGLLVGVAVLATGNPFLILVVAPVVLVNGGTGIVKVVLLRIFRALGFDITPPSRQKTAQTDTPQEDAPEPADTRQLFLIRWMHRVRFPLHDHCRKELDWRNPQVLMRFVLLQAFLTPLLLGIVVKIR